MPGLWRHISWLVGLATGDPLPGLVLCIAVLLQPEHQADIQIERENNEIVLFFKCIWEIRTDNPSLAMKILNGQSFQVKKAWLEMARDNLSQIFTTFLPQIFFV